MSHLFILTDRGPTKETKAKAYQGHTLPWKLASDI